MATLNEILAGAQGIGFRGDAGQIKINAGFHHAPVDGDKGGKKSGSYKITGNSLQEITWAFFENHKNGQKYRYPADGQDSACNQSPGERLANSLIAEKKRQEDERERAKRQEKAAEDSSTVWEAAGPVPNDHPVLITKRVQSHEARFEKSTGALIIKIVDRNGNHVSIQRIFDKSQRGENEPTKLLYKYGQKKGCFSIIEGKEDKIFIAEGWATAATVNELTGCKAYVAIDAGNLLSVAKTVREIYPDWKNPKPIIIAADNDWKKAEEIGKNTGLEAGKEAADAIGADLIYPEGIEGTDFNDMRSELGDGPTKAALLQEKPRVKSLTAREIMETDYPPIKWAAEGIIPEGLTIIAGRPKFGKSWMMLGLCYAVAMGFPAWEYARTKKGSAYYLALEDSYRRAKDRMQSMEGYFDTYPDNLHIFTDFPRIGNGFVRELERIVQSDKNTGIVVVDTLQKVRPKSNGGKRNLYQAEYEDYERLQRFSIHYGVPVVCVHHTRKGSPGAKNSSPIDEMSGSTGIQGVADTLIVCTRDGNQGIMHVTGREVNEEDYPLEFNRRNMTWKLFPPEQQQIDIGPMMLSEFFKTNVEITVKQAADVFDVNERTARRMIGELVDQGRLIICRSEGPLKYYSPSNIF
ncbi:MAG: AAA family ATPase [Desulfobulbaceae bacterium]|nr:AAA family ATPase [Desulfobulbaceae bacterium]